MRDGFARSACRVAPRQPTPPESRPSTRGLSQLGPPPYGGACLRPRSAAVPDLAYDVVVPTTGRASLARLLSALAAGDGLPPRALILVDDRPEPDRGRLLAAVPAGLSARVEVLATRGCGPAAARNAGWRAARAAWVAFLDDDVAPPPDWRERLQADLRRRAPPGLPRARAGRLAPPRPGVHSEPGPRARAAPARPACDRLGAERRRA